MGGQADYIIQLSEWNRQCKNILFAFLQLLVTLEQGRLPHVRMIAHIFLQSIFLYSFL